jgi:hypothetical protein
MLWEILDHRTPAASQWNSKCDSKKTKKGEYKSYAIKPSFSMYGGELIN